MGINLRVEGIRRVLSTICSVAGTISAVAESERKSTPSVPKYRVMEGSNFVPKYKVLEG
jgi:hypothetical protein